MGKKKLKEDQDWFKRYKVISKELLVENLQKKTKGKENKNKYK